MYRSSNRTTWWILVWLSKRHRDKVENKISTVKRSNLGSKKNNLNGIVNEVIWLLIYISFFHWVFLACSSFLSFHLRCRKMTNATTCICIEMRKIFKDMMNLVLAFDCITVLCLKVKLCVLRKESSPPASTLTIFLLNPFWASVTFILSWSCCCWFLPLDCSPSDELLEAVGSLATLVSGEQEKEKRNQI